MQPAVCNDCGAHIPIEKYTNTIAISLCLNASIIVITKGKSCKIVKGHQSQRSTIIGDSSRLSRQIPVGWRHFSSKYILQDIFKD